MLPANYKVWDKFQDISRSYKKYYIFIVGIIITLVIYITYQNFLSTLTMVMCTIIFYLFLAKPKTELDLIVDYDFIIINNNKIEIRNCLGFTVVDLGDILEIIIQVSSFTQEFIYLYTEENKKESFDLINNLSQLIPYNPQIREGNYIHRILRKMSMK